ncbi:Transcription elongation factor 1-like protein [Hibiscus syriacus]|uniref:Transcription elongation factor 1 homolog n=1 Tax=Hibiscus syriacus TaxID=106335 RepID=A0A6A2XNY1_HIBSY|nr:Transcription elongation factor 1-like protein [Hibiscus syriacus]
MGKRKSRAKPAAKKRMDKLDTVFSCPFCNHGTSVECRIDMKNLIGEASCRICQESFSTVITDTANGSMNVNELTTSMMMMMMEIRTKISSLENGLQRLSGIRYGQVCFRTG